MWKPRNECQPGPASAAPPAWPPQRDCGRVTRFKVDRCQYAINNPIPIQHWSVPPSCLEYQSFNLQYASSGGARRRPSSRTRARGRICVKIQSSQVNKQLLLPVRKTRAVRFVRLLQEWRTGGGDEPPPIPPHLLSASPMAGDAGTHSSLYKCGWEFGKYQSLYTKGMHRFKTCQDHGKDVF